MRDCNPCSVGSDPVAGKDPEDRAEFDYRLNRLTLLFRDPRIELRFTHESIQRSLPIIRVAGIASALVYALFGLLDWLVVGPALNAVWAIRYVVVCPILLALVGVTYHPRYYRFAQLTMTAGMLAAGYGIVAMTAVIGPPASHYYYAGLFMVVLYASSLIRLRYVYSSAASFSLVVAYDLVATLVNPIPTETLINNNFFLVLALAVGIFSNYGLELFGRQNFVSNHLLIREKTRSDRLLRAAEAANEAKSNFLAVVSHELRTPLNAIIGFSEILKGEMFGAIGSPQYKEYSEDIHKSGCHLLEIINDILDISKAEAGKLEVQESRIDLRELIDECLRIFRDEAAAGPKLSFAHSEPIELWADQRLMRQVVINLISNAVKFTEPDGTVIVSVEYGPSGECLIRIADTGVGISEADIKEVFKPFVQAENALNRTHEGTGLGLPLVKRIVERHGGTLDLESRVGVGTTATVTIPAERVSELPKEPLAPVLAAS